MIMIVVMGYVDIVNALIIFVLTLAFIFALIPCGLTINLAKPNLFQGEKENNNNMILLMIIGFLISILIGVVVIILSFASTYLIASLVAFGIIAVFSVISMVVLIKSYPKLYARMEVA